jgi:hypothetical protein
LCYNGITIEFSYPKNPETNGTHLSKLDTPPTAFIKPIMLNIALALFATGFHTTPLNHWIQQSKKPQK